MVSFRDEVEPVQIERDSARGEAFSHPAFGQITVSRISGSRTLYGSDFRHNNFVRVIIHESQLCRDLSHDWHFPRREITSVDMSEAQWATFVSSFNIGEGVPCTIVHADGERRPGIALRDTVGAFKKEAQADIDAVASRLKALRAKLEDETCGLSKTKRSALLDDVERAITEIECNLPFVTESFDRHIEKTVEKAKVEVNSWMTGAVLRAGLEVLGGMPPLQIDGPDEER